MGVDWDRVREIFNEAVSLPPGERVAFVRGACGGDADLDAAVLGLIRADAPGPRNPLDSPNPLGALIGASAPMPMIGPYVVLAEVGKGSWGTVYLAQDPRLSRHIAIKVLNEDLRRDPEVVSRFRREAEHLSRLNHPNIATLYTFDESDAGPYIAMEYVPGPTVAEAVEEGPLPLDAVLRIGRDVSEAVAVAHRQGIIHRDLKPANVKVPEDGQARVLDFGIARAVERAELHNGSMSGTSRWKLIGTPGYIAPETIRTGVATERSDVFGIGCILYECVTGRVAFDGGTPADRLAATLSTTPREDVLPPGTPHSLKELIVGCLEADASKRIGEARIVASRLAAIQEALRAPGPPAEIHRPIGTSTPESGSRDWLKPGRMIIAGLVALTVVALTWLALVRTPPGSNELAVPDGEISVTRMAPWSGRPTVIYGFSHGTGGGQVVAREIGSDTVFWTASPHVDEFAAVFGPEYAEEGGYSVGDIYFADVNGDDEDDVIVTHGHRSWFPTALTVYTRDGRRLGTYYHPGRIRNVISFDPDADNHDELVVIATHNGAHYQGASIFMLNERHLHGAAVDSLWPPDRVVPDQLPECALARVVFPAFDPPFMDLGNAPRLDTHEVQFGYLDDVPRVSMSLGFRGAGLIVELDRELNPLSVSVSDALRGVTQSWPKADQERFLSQEYLDGWLARHHRYEGVETRAPGDR